MIFGFLRRRRPHLRRLTAEDVGDWAALRAEAMALHPEAFGSTHDDMAGHPTAFAEQLTDEVVVGAFDEGRLIGALGLDPQTDPKAGIVTSVYIRPDWRRKGVARRLFHLALGEARKRGLQRLTLTVAEDNHPAIHFYQGQGFRFAGRGDRVLASDGRFLELIELAREL